MIHSVGLVEDCLILNVHTGDSFKIAMMSASAVKPALPTAGTQASKVGSGAPPATTNNPPPPPAGGPKVLPTAGSPNKSIALPSANHAAVGSVPLSLVQEHKTGGGGGGGLNQQPPPRTPEKTKEHPVTLGVKPTSNGVEGSLNRPTATSQPPAESKKLDEGSAAAPVLNHSADVAPAAATPPQTQGLATGQPTQNNPLVAGAQASPPKPQPAAVLAGAANHSALLNVTNKLEGMGVEGKPSLPEESAEPAPVTVPFGSTTVTSTQHQQPQVASAQLPGPSQQLAPPQQPQPPPPSPQQQQMQLAPPPPQQQTQLVPQQQQQQSPLTPQPQQTSPQQQQQLQPPAPPQQQVPLLPTQQEHHKPTSASADTSKPRTEAPKAEFKVATPPRNSKRKREVKPPTEAAKTPASEQDDRKSKRVRTQTQPYQSPLPELTYIAKLKTLMKSPDDKLIVFYKNEFLAVRNAEGSFYICQAMQNIYKSSPRIRIRWLSQEKKDNKPTDVYIPDFYDATDFDCILTNLELKKLDKNKFQLPEEERERTQSILKRALDVEKGVSESGPVTEEHPDGLDLSLFRDESQLKKRKSVKRTSRRKENTSVAEDGYEGLTGDDESEEEVKKKKPKPNKRVEKAKVSVKEKVKTKEKPVEKRAERTSERGRDRGLASKRRSESVAAAVAVKNAAMKQTVAKHAAVRQAAFKALDKKTKVVVKPTKKPEPVAESSIPTRSAKTRSAKVTSQPKSSPVTRTKEREHRGAIPAKGRKKPGKKA